MVSVFSPFFWIFRLKGLWPLKKGLPKTTTASQNVSISSLNPAQAAYLFDFLNRKRSRPFSTAFVATHLTPGGLAD